MILLSAFVWIYTAFSIWYPVLKNTFSAREHVVIGSIFLIKRLLFSGNNVGIWNVAEKNMRMSVHGVYILGEEGEIDNDQDK